MLYPLHPPRQSPGQREPDPIATWSIHGLTIIVNTHQSYEHMISLLLVLLTRIELVARPYQGRVLPLYYRSMLVSATRIELIFKS